MGKLFTTSDIWLASFLSLRGLKPALQNKDNRIVFVFARSDELFKLIAAFNAGNAVSIDAYIESHKRLKAQMFEARGSAR